MRNFEKLFNAAAKEKVDLDDLRARFERLTPREREVIHLVAYGYNSRDLAAELGISVKTADIHRANVGHKLRTSRVADLTRFYFLLLLSPLKAKRSMEQIRDDAEVRRAMKKPKTKVK